MASPSTRDSHEDEGARSGWDMMKSLCDLELLCLNVFLYDGMSSAEVSSLLSACVSSAHVGRGPAPRILAIRELSSGTVVPLSLAVKHWPSLDDRCQLIDEHGLDQEETNTQRYQQQQQQQQATKVTAQTQSRVSSAGPSRVPPRVQASSTFQTRPASSPASVFASNPHSIAGLPTPIPRNSAGASASVSAQQQFQHRPRPDQSFGGWADFGDRSSASRSYNTGTAAAAATRAGSKYNFTGAGYDSSPYASSPESSPRFTAVASPTSSIADSLGSLSGWSGQANSGIHVVLSYPELLNILTGHVAPNVNNGPRPPATRQRHFMFALAIVQAGSQSCEDIFLEYQRFAASDRYTSLVFLIMEADLLRGSSLEVDDDALPSFQFFLSGHLLGQLTRPTPKQLATILASSNRLVADNPDLRVEDGEEVDEEEEEEESDQSYESEEEVDWRRAAQRAVRNEPAPNRARPQPTLARPSFGTGYPSSQSLGQALDGSYGLSAAERREVFENAAEEDARWAQLLQASPKQSPARRGTKRAWRRSPQESPEPSDSEGEGYTAPPSSGLVIRGQKVKIHAAPVTSRPTQQPAQQKGRASSSAPRMQDWTDYERFDVADSVDESDYGSDAAYSPSESSIHEAASTWSRKRKTNPIASEEEEEDEYDDYDEYGSEAGGVGVADGGSDYSRAISLSPRLDSGASSAFASLTHSPALRAAAAPTQSASATASTSQGVVMSPSEARAIERLILRQDPDVRAAFRACPDLDALLEVFVRLVSVQIAQPINRAAAPALSASAPGASPAVSVGSPSKTLKRKDHPVQTLVGQEPRHKRLHAEAERAARAAAAEARARHKRVNEQVYATSEEEEEAEPSESDADLNDDEYPGASERERAALAHLRSQQEKYASLQAQYLSIQNEIFSKTVHDLASHGLLSREHHAYLVHLWTATEAGSDAIRALIKQYEEDGDEARFMHALIQLAKRFADGRGVGAEASASEVSEQEDDEEDDDDAVRRDAYASESPLNSDEERQYQALLKQFEQSHVTDAAAESSESPSDSEVSDDEQSPSRVPRSSTKAPRPSPTSGALPANQFEAKVLEVAAENNRSPGPQSESASLASNLDLVSRLVSSELLSAADGHRAQQYLVHGHPLLQAAFLAFSYNEDIEDLVDTLLTVLKTSASRTATPAKQAETKTEVTKPTEAAPKPALTGLPSATLRDPQQLLSIMPPWIVSSHRPVLEQLVRSQDVVLLAAWDVLQAAIAARHSADHPLAIDVEEFIDTVTRRMQSVEEDEEEEKKAEAEEPTQKTDNTDSTDAASNPATSAFIADALQVTSVLHTGRVFDDEETCVLWSLILSENPVISAAFDIARDDEEWEELHDTLIRLLTKHAHLKSRFHPLLPLVRQATGVMSAADVAHMQQIMRSAEVSKSTPPRAKSQALPAAATPISPSIPQSGWSRVVRAFTTALSSLQASSSLTDAGALALIDLLQARAPIIVAAAEEFERDGNQAQFEEALRVIAAQQAKQKQQTTDPTSSRQRLIQSFAERVQAVDEMEAAGLDDDEDQTDDDEDEDDASSSGSVDSLDEFLARDDVADWDDQSLAALQAQVEKMQLELARLKQTQRDQGRPVEDTDEDDEDDEDEWDVMEEEQEDAEEEQQDDDNEA